MVYIYGKRIPHKLELNQAHKNTFYFSAPSRIRAPNSVSRAPIIYWNKMCLTLPLGSFNDNKVLKIVNWIC